VLHRLNGSKPPARMVDMEPFLRGAARAARNLTEALRPLAAEDQTTIGVERSVLAMLAASLADRADAGALAALAAATEADPAGKVAIARRSLVGLVNAGRTDLARQVQAQHDLDAASLEVWQPGQAWDAGKRDALFCLGMLELAPDGDLALARRRFALVRALEPEGPLASPALRGERVAAERMGDADDAAAVSDAARSLRAAGPTQPLGWRRQIGGYLRGVIRRSGR